MKKTFILALILAAFPLQAGADTIIFKDGMRIEALRVWKSNGEIKCEIGGVVFGYPKSDVARILKKPGEESKAAAHLKKAANTVTVAGEKQPATQPKEVQNVVKKTAISRQKQTAAKKQNVVSQRVSSGSKMQVLPAKKEVSAFKKTAAVHLNAAPTPQRKRKLAAKQIPVFKKKFPAKKAVVSQYARIPTFEVIINEDNNNPPVYIKRGRVLLVSQGTSKAQIRALLLNYERRLRNELNARKAEYKMIEVWAYDDFDRADEGAAGWIGKISNKQKSGKLSDSPELVIK